MAKRKGRPFIVRTIKRAIRDRDEYRCTECRMTNVAHLRRWGRSLEVHRIVPQSEYGFDGCTTLCKMCHSAKPHAPSVHVRQDRGSPNGSAQMLLEMLELRGKQPTATR